LSTPEANEIRRSYSYSNITIASHLIELMFFRNGVLTCFSRIVKSTVLLREHILQKVDSRPGFPYLPEVP
jgi:hypothetical protein